MNMLPQKWRHWLKQRRPSVKRSIALEQEIQFWRNWFDSGGLQWPQDFHGRFNPNQPIQGHVATYIDRIESNPVHILDVGSGPLTKLGKKHPSKQLVITATDLLASEYDRLLSELGLEPLIRTVFAHAEKLVEQFGQNAFDIVHGQNSIDHTAHPVHSIEQMLAVCKPLGYVILYHAENEGQTEEYQQLHQWDFTCENGDFIMGDRRGRKTNVTKKLASTGEVTCMREGGAILSVIYKKAN
jgi:SAM-dependent methyltransferase